MKRSSFWTHSVQLIVLVTVTQFEDAYCINLMKKVIGKCYTLCTKKLAV